MNKIFSPELRFQAGRNDWEFGVFLMAALRNEDGTPSIAQPAVFVAQEVGAAVPRAPLLKMGDDDATRLMDALWSAGVRPSNGEGNVGQIGAMREHLQDMRSLVFNQRQTVQINTSIKEALKL